MGVARRHIIAGAEAARMHDPVIIKIIIVRIANHVIAVGRDRYARESSVSRLRIDRTPMNHASIEAQ